MILLRARLTPFPWCAARLQMLRSLRRGLLGTSYVATAAALVPWVKARCEEAEGEGDRREMPPRRTYHHPSEGGFVGVFLDADSTAKLQELHGGEGGRGPPHAVIHLHPTPGDQAVFSPLYGAKVGLLYPRVIGPGSMN
jgi:hypothetical protein